VDAVTENVTKKMQNSTNRNVKSGDQSDHTYILTCMYICMQACMYVYMIELVYMHLFMYVKLDIHVCMYECCM